MIRAQPPYPWQDTLWQHFVSQVRDARVAHATLITGKRGTGLVELAEGMAHYLLCIAPLDDLACGQCRSCQLFASQSHPDYRTLYPEEGKQQIRIDQVRDLQEYIGKTAQMNGRKLILLAPAEAMNESAANALLKNLEEPAGDTVFLLVSHFPRQVKPTIRSRCAKLAAPLPAADTATKWLNDQGVSSAQSLLTQAAGEPLTVLEWNNNGVYAAREELINTLAAYGLGQCSRQQLLQVASKMDIALTLNALLTWLETLITAAHTHALPVFLTPLERTLVDPKIQELYRGIDKLQKRRADLQDGYNLNSDLLLDELLRDWCQAVLAKF